MATFRNLGGSRWWSLPVACVVLTLGGRGAFAAESWVHVYDAPAGILTLHAQGETVVAGTADGVLISTDSGVSWDTAGLGGQQVRTLTSIGGYIVAGTADGIYRSSDNGNHWDKVKNENYFGVVALGINEGNVIASCDYFRWDQLWSSEDSAGSWTMIWDARMLRLRAFAEINDYLVAGLACYDSTLSLTQGSVYRSTDNGVTWTPGVLLNAPVVCVAGTNGYVFASAGGVKRSPDYGASWLDVGLETTTVRCFTLVGTTLLAGTSTQGVAATGDFGSTWFDYSDGLPSGQNVISLVTTGEYLVAGVGGSAIYRVGVRSLYPDTPLLSSPGNGATGISTSPLMSWTTSSTATSYHLQISSDWDFSTVVYDSNGLTANSLVAEYLSGATLHYWRVSASNGAGSSDPTAAWTFTTRSGPYSGSPIDIPGMLEVEWYDGGGEGMTYHDSDPENVGHACRRAEGVDIEQCTDPESEGFNIGWTRAGEWLSYSVNIAASGPYQMQARVAFDGTSGGRFHVELDQTDVSGPVFVPGTGGNQSWVTVNDTVLLAAGTHVLSLVMDETAPGGDVGNFNFLQFDPILLLPDPVVLLVPADGAVYLTDTVAAVWHTCEPGVTRYWCEIATDSLFVFRSIDSSSTDTSHTFRQLTASRYWWRVKGGNAAGWGPFSEERSFRVTPTGVAVTADLPTEYSLSQNYPNPFNPSTTIKYTLPQSGYVTLRVYDALGEELATLVHGEQSAGSFKATWDASGMSSGVYFYRLTAGNYAQTRKMLLMR